jgi:hypothetical protein
VHQPTAETPTPRRSEPGPHRAGVAGWVLLLAALLLILAFGTTPERSMFWDAVFDAGHTPLFGLAALAILGLLRARGTTGGRTRTSWLAFALTVTLGAVTEALQVFQANRDPSLEDFLRDVAGAGAFLLAEGAWPRREARAARGGHAGRALALLLAVLLLIASGARLAVTTAAYVERRRALPTLFALDGSWRERRFIGLHDSMLTPGSRPPGLEASFDEPLACLDLRPGLYPGVALDEPYPDWSGYSRLVFTVVSDLDRPASLTIRVHDAAHDQRYEDRFNRSLTVAPGVNRFAITLDDIRRAPDRREMDMRRIRGVMLFAYQLKRPTRVYLVALRLE